MKLPNEEQWLRVEALANEFAALTPDEAASHLSQLAAAGESPTVLTMVGSWLGVPPSCSPLVAGNVVGGRYTLNEKIGEGGMGAVWRAKQELIGRDVALKIIHPALVTPALKSRFVGEIELLGLLDHPGIVKIFDAGMHEQPGLPAIPFFAMELVEGLPLDRWSALRRNDRAALLHLAGAVCEAVQSAHERKIVHRDLKPSNIIVRDSAQPVVLDFGIARLASAADERGVFSGTPQYAAPEQHLGRDRDFRSGESVDVYAAGAILFQMLSGRKVFEFPAGASLSEMRRIVLEAPLPRLSQVLPDCPHFLDEILGRALRRDPADRYYSMAALGRAILRAAVLLTPTEVSPKSWTPASNRVVPGTGWRLTQKIGEGGAGAVWIGVHDQLKETRVFKFCDTEDKARTLKRELTLFRLLKERVGRNPHFIQLHEVSLDEPPWYLMMDYAEARDLEMWSAEQPGGLQAIPEEMRLEIVAQIAEALQAAHEAGILHRDVKPGNVLVRGGAAGAPLHVLIADFGIGQIVADELLAKGTRLGFTRTVADLQRSKLSGTMLYMAPEVLEGNPATARSDIYSLGVLFWQLLIGNFATALDPADWQARVSDSLLREDLTRCLAGSPNKRWGSAGELAAGIRALPARRAAEARRVAEIRAREQAAYRRGVLRSIAVAAAIVCAVLWLAWTAWMQRRKAESARGEIALEQAGTLPRTDFAIGRRERGLRLLETAAATVTNRASLRTAAAAVLGMSDFVKVAERWQAPQPPPVREIAHLASETCRSVSSDGAIIALARDLDGVNGVVELFDAASGERHATIERKQFPWVPIAEAGLFGFSPDNKLLAIGGPATSRHVLVCNVPNPTVSTYLFHSSDPLCCAWHPGGRVIATGCADGTVRIWDTSLARTSTNSFPGNQFDLPPALDVPALDVPEQTLRVHRGPIRYLAFSTDGRWLASVDGLGYLLVHGGFSRAGLPRPGQAARSQDNTGVGKTPVLYLAMEMRLEGTDRVESISPTAEGFALQRQGKPAVEYRPSMGELPTELYVAAGLANIAWNSKGTELCAISLTDIYWLQERPIEVFFAAPGKNPVGVCFEESDGFWILPKATQFIESRPARDGQGWRLDRGASFALAEAVKGQGARTSMTVAGDGRVAIYRGRRIQFFARHEAAPLDASLLADGRGGVFQDLIWDTPGQLLMAVFRLPSGVLRIESWQTSADFPPKCHSLAPIEVEAQRVVSANDGRHCLARGGRLGLWRLDLATKAQTTLDASPVAQQNGPLAATSDGRFLGMIVEGNIVRLLRLPDGAFFADLHSRNQATVTALAWDASGRHLADLTQDGYVQTWNLAPWQDWLTRHGLEK